MTVNVRYLNCPRAYHDSRSFYSELVALTSGEPVHVVQGSGEVADLEFHSVHPPFLGRTARFMRAKGLIPSRKGLGVSGARRRSPKTPQVWFTGENVRPPTGPWSGYFSFDLDDLGGRNVYLPFWFECIGLLSRPTVAFAGEPGNWETLLNERPTLQDGREKFMCTFIGNPTSMRSQAIAAMSRIGRVDVYGKASGVPVKDKHEVAKDYQFVLCFENDLYPGYVTEKPFDAWSTGAIPVWWGCDPAGYLNARALLNLHSLGSMDRLVQMVKQLTLSPAGRAEISSSPILRRPPDLEAPIRLLKRVL